MLELKWFQKRRLSTLECDLHQAHIGRDLRTTVENSVGFQRQLY